MLHTDDEMPSFTVFRKLQQGHVLSTINLSLSAIITSWTSVKEMDSFTSASKNWI